MRYTYYCCYRYRNKSYSCDIAKSRRQKRIIEWNRWKKNSLNTHIDKNIIQIVHFIYVNQVELWKDQRLLANEKELLYVHCAKCFLFEFMWNACEYSQWTATTNKTIRAPLKAATENLWLFNLNLVVFPISWFRKGYWMQAKHKMTSKRTLIEFRLAHFDLLLFEIYIFGIV